MELWFWQSRFYYSSSPGSGFASVARIILRIRTSGVKWAAWNWSQRGHDERKAEEADVDIWKSFCLCLLQTAAAPLPRRCLRVCGRLSAPRHVSLVPLSKRTGLSTFSPLGNCLKEIEKRGSERHRGTNRREEGGRGTEEALNFRLCCYWLLLKGLSVIQGAARKGSVFLQRPAPLKSPTLLLYI